MPKLPRGLDVDPGEALSYTIRMLYLHPGLPKWHQLASGADLADTEARVLDEWRRETGRLGKPKARHATRFRNGLLEAAERYLEAAQAALDARWGEVLPTLEEAPQRAIDMCTAVFALSRHQGPEVLLTDRVAVDVIESMTGRRWLMGDRPGITRGKRWLVSRDICTLAFMPGSTSTVYCLLTQGITPTEGQCPVSLPAGVRPLLSERDLMVRAWSRASLKAGEKWQPGQAVAVVDAALARDADEDARRAEFLASDPVFGPFRKDVQPA
jgi:hypothetical protein